MDTARAAAAAARWDLALMMVLMKDWRSWDAVLALPVEIGGVVVACFLAPPRGIRARRLVVVVVGRSADVEAVAVGRFRGWIVGHTSCVDVDG